MIGYYFIINRNGRLQKKKLYEILNDSADTDFFFRARNLKELQKWIKIFFLSVDLSWSNVEKKMSVIDDPVWHHGKTIKKYQLYFGNEHKAHSTATIKGTLFPSDCLYGKDGYMRVIYGNNEVYVKHEPIKKKSGKHIVYAEAL